MKLSWYFYVFGVLVLCIAVQSVRLDLAKASESRSLAAMAVYKSAAIDNLQAIDTLTKANKLWSAGSLQQQSAAQTYIKQANDYADAETMKATAVKRQLDKLYAEHPKARAWADTAVDPDVAASLRAGGTN